MTGKGRIVTLNKYIVFKKLLTRNSEKGQVVLIVVLVMVVALTVGLSIATRSVTNLRTSTEEISSQQALSAAEAGVEQVLKSSSSIATDTLSNGTTYKTDISAVSGTSFLLAGGNITAKNDSIDLWLSDYSVDPAKLYANPWSGSLTVYWGTSSTSCNNAALEIALITGPKTSPKVTKYGFDPCSARANSNNLTFVSSSSQSVAGKTFYHNKVITVTNGIIARIVPLYVGTAIGILGSSALPSQGSIINSTGTSGNTQRKVNVFQGYPKLPSEFFPYGLFSP